MSFCPHFGIIFGPFWCVFDPFVAFFLGPSYAKNGSLGGGLGKKKCIETVKPYFEERVWSYRSVKEPGQTDTDSSRYDPFLVPERPFYIGIENSFRSYLL